MSRERIVSGGVFSEEEEQSIGSLRPKLLAEYIGQSSVVNKLHIALSAAKMRSEPLEHVLLHGPPGLGKTTLAHIISNEMGGRLVSTSGPALERAGDLMGILTNLQESDLLFIDEIHRLPTVVEEFIYPAMEDFQVDFVVDKGAFAKTIKLPLKRFTLVGATTRAGLLSAPLRERFGIFHHLDFYSWKDIYQILDRSARLLDVPSDREGLEEIATRSRGTPRVANRLLRRVRDYAQVKSDGAITRTCASLALALEGIDELGLDDLDRKFLRAIAEFYGGGPAGIEAIAATLAEEVDTLEDMVEPFLLKIGFVSRTRTGRRLHDPAFRHLGLEIRRKPLQQDLFTPGPMTSEEARG